MEALNLETIARRCNVSLSTVSRVLNNKPGIAAETRQRILEVAEEYGFVLQRRKRPLARSELIIVLVIPEEEELSVNPFLNITELIGSINEAFPREKKRIEVIASPDSGAFGTGGAPRADGVILAYRAMPEGMRSHVAKMGIPCIYLSRLIADQNYVSCNWFKGTLALGEHLIAVGHRTIGYLGNGPNPNNIDRLRGYRAALEEGGIPFREELVVNAPSILAVDRAVATTFSGRGCDAVICFNDYMALNLINELNAAGLSVPGDLSVTGFDDSPLRRVYKPLLTTIRQPIYDMGFLASRWLRDNILNRRSRPLRAEIDGTLLAGESVRDRR
ncbi:MAG: LacI family DNA-binding transcriptional regulator [Spirochaetes bacterium]|nr:LacI family DNA-binding transcriptional regulator [Spirochaetota bacterium]